MKRYNGNTGAFMDDFVPVGEHLYSPVDLEFATMNIRSLSDYPRWSFVPRWLQVIGLGVLAALVIRGIEVLVNGPRPTPGRSIR